MKRINFSAASAAIATVALFAALGGPATAATLLTGKDIKNGSLTGADLQDEALTGADVKDGSLTAADLAPDADQTRWLVVNAQGNIEAQSGGFRIANAYPATPAAASGNVYIESGDTDLSNNAIVASIALQNQIDQNGDGVRSGAAAASNANPEFSGEISATLCGIANVVVCAPQDINTGADPKPTNTANYLVVSPRLSDGQRTDPGARKRFHVIISGPRN